MNSVSVQIQRAISDAISTQVLPQIQNVIMAGSGHGTKKGWAVPSERPEPISEVQRNLNAKSNLRNEQDDNQLNNDFPELNVHDRPLSFFTFSRKVTKPDVPKGSPLGFFSVLCGVFERKKLKKFQVFQQKFF